MRNSWRRNWEDSESAIKGRLQKSNKRNQDSRGGKESKGEGKLNGREKRWACGEDQSNVETEEIGKREEVINVILRDPKWPVRVKKKTTEKTNWVKIVKKQYTI